MKMSNYLLPDNHQSRRPSTFIDSCSSNEDNVAALHQTNRSRNIIAFDDAIVDIGDCGSSESTNSVDEEDTQSRSSSTDLNNFLKIKEVANNIPIINNYRKDLSDK